ncbi:UDP-3-O-acyl-N-acetylglucosamine deacetylase [Rhodovibrio salinarum]|uniref:UDP-3-O-acyl-N-acetylglucosamine deacetylase n=1 Tax=Rhodovibrio salinarum TaxID=1087 RepID=A0A934UYY6_9PROT|nr:UDP-3-O-acyl-N-acetylglucosamine deacetylase [Rhodovibrio salinarum]MBK1696507.1 UDP-3-O-acyl-N-acetylglucosamine deacetylase [Rhodovibrio salinarum]
MGTLRGLHSLDTESARRASTARVSDPVIGGDSGYQHTIKNEIHCSGVGLHSGAKIAMTLKPGAPDSGIVFRRKDLAGAPSVRALHKYGQETPLCTTVANNEAKVATIEHLMSALAACGIDNAEIDLDGAEVPIMDGSAAPFVFLVECAGILVQEAPRKAIRILKTVEIDDGDRHASLAPARSFWIDFEIDFNSDVVSRQTWSGGINRQQFKSDLARARTFGFLQEVDQLRQHGLARGGSLDNAVVIDGNGVMNEGGLRFEDEFVRHKVLDSIGDLYLAGAPILGRFTGKKTGHAMNLRLLRALFADDSAWCWVDMARADLAPGASVPPARAVAARA